MAKFKNLRIAACWVEGKMCIGGEADSDIRRPEGRHNVLSNTHMSFGGTFFYFGDYISLFLMVGLRSFLKLC